MKMFVLGMLCGLCAGCNTMAPEDPRNSEFGNGLPEQHTEQALEPFPVTPLGVKKTSEA
jgi:hypothetical protein